jgi:hypothetical protein
MCKSPVNPDLIMDRSTVQLDEKTVLPDLANFMRQYPYGYVLVAPVANDQLVLADEDAVTAVRQLFDARDLRLVSDEEINAGLEQLNAMQLQLVVVDMLRHCDFHRTSQILTKYNSLVAAYVQSIRVVIRQTFENRDWVGYAGRAAISVATDAVVMGVTKSTNTGMGLDFSSNCIAFALLSVVEIYRWSTGDITTAELAVNIGEHCAGCGTAAISSFYCAMGGAAVGALGGPVLSIICAVLAGLLGGFAGDVLARMAYRKAVATVSSSQEERVREKAFKDAGIHLGINIYRHSFSEAKAVYRSLIIRYHPDRRPADEAENIWNERAGNLIANWNIVRAYYVKKGDLGAVGANVAEPEAFVQIFMMKVRDQATGFWRTTKTWFDEVLNYPDGYRNHPDNPTIMVNKVILYV